jgi:hypothetical protein
MLNFFLQTTLCEKPIIEDILFLKIISTKCQPYYHANGIEKSCCHHHQQHVQQFVDWVTTSLWIISKDKKLTSSSALPHMKSLLHWAPYLLYPKQGFLRILWCTQSGNNPENNLVKFGYILHMEVEEKVKILFIFLVTLVSKSGDFNCFPSKIGKFGLFFH